MTTVRPASILAPHAAALLVVGLLACFLAGCKTTTRPPVGETPQQISAQIDKASELVRDAQRLELAGHDHEAIAKYQAAIASYRELPVAWNNLGRLLMKESNNLAAADAFKTASELSPTDPRPMHNLGTLWESLGYYDDASRWYDEALRRDENYLPSLRRCVVVEEIRNRPDSTTLERIRRGLLQETDPWWIERFKRAKNRFENLIEALKNDSMTNQTQPTLPNPRPTPPDPLTRPSPVQNAPPSRP